MTLSPAVIPRIGMFKSKSLNMNPYPNNNPLIGEPVNMPGGEPLPLIVQQITIRPPVRRKMEIIDWRVALRNAEAIVPRYVLLYDLYAELWLDAHLNSVAKKRIMGVTNANWRFVDKNGIPVPAINHIIDTLHFEQVLAAFVCARLEGYRMVECDYKEGRFTAYTVPPKHMRPRTGYVAFDQNSDDGINIREGIYSQTVMEIGDPYDLGLFISAAQYVLYKRGGFGDWANFVEVFGQPIIDAEWDGYDEKQRLQLEEALNRMGNGGKITRPAGTKINLLENKANANGELQHHFVTQLNLEISKVILGQTETTESSASSGYAQSLIHAQVEDDINESDVNYARRGLNTRFVEILKALGVPGIDGGRFIVQGEPEHHLPANDRLQMDIALVRELNLPVDDDYFYEAYNIPKPANYEAIKKSVDKIPAKKKQYVSSQT
jgi:phage gp29-like protein